MMKLFGRQRVEEIIRKYDAWIDQVAVRYKIPANMIRVILYQELTRLDIFDPLVDLIVRLRIFRKKDSSTGYAQVFGYVGLNAVNFAVSRGLTSYEALGIKSDHPLRTDSKEDVFLVWKLLNEDPKANIEIAALNLIAAAEELTGKIDFSTFSPDEIARIFSRYNARTKGITAYGREAYERYRGLEGEDRTAIVEGLH